MIQFGKPIKDLKTGFYERLYGEEFSKWKLRPETRTLHLLDRLQQAADSAGSILPPSLSSSLLDRRKLGVGAIHTLFEDVARHLNIPHPNLQLNQENLRAYGPHYDTLTRRSGVGVYMDEVSPSNLFSPLDDLGINTRTDIEAFLRRKRSGLPLSPAFPSDIHSGQDTSTFTPTPSHIHDIYVHEYGHHVAYNTRGTISNVLGQSWEAELLFDTLSSRARGDEWIGGGKFNIFTELDANFMAARMGVNLRETDALHLGLSSYLVDTKSPEQIMSHDTITRYFNAWEAGSERARMGFNVRRLAKSMASDVFGDDEVKELFTGMRQARSNLLRNSVGGVIQPSETMLKDLLDLTPFGREKYSKRLTLPDYMWEATEKSLYLAKKSPTMSSHPSTNRVDLLFDATRATQQYLERQLPFGLDFSKNVQIEVDTQGGGGHRKLYGRFASPDSLNFINETELFNYLTGTVTAGDRLSSLPDTDELGYFALKGETKSGSTATIELNRKISMFQISSVPVQGGTLTADGGRDLILPAPARISMPDSQGNMMVRELDESIPLIAQLRRKVGGGGMSTGAPQLGGTTNPSTPPLSSLQHLTPTATTAAMVESSKMAETAIKTNAKLMSQRASKLLRVL